ncbi:MAG: hypothetical protein WBO48_18270 [Candidatus Promineifilaceae bacterium]
MLASFCSRGILSPPLEDAVRNRGCGYFSDKLLDGRSFTLDDGSFTLDDGSFTLDDGSFPLDGDSFTLNGRSFPSSAKRRAPQQAL